MGSAMMNAARSAGGGKKSTSYLTASKTVRVKGDISPVVNTYKASFEYEPEFVIVLFTEAPTAYGAESPYAIGSAAVLAQGQSTNIFTQKYANDPFYVTALLMFSGCDITLTVKSISAGDAWYSMPHYVNLFLYGIR